MAALYFLNLDPDAYVSDWYKKPIFCATYKNTLKPVKGSDMWPKTTFHKVLSPKAVGMSGRPTIKRKRDVS